MLGVLFHGCIAVALTVVTQIGGLVWLVSRLLPRPLLSFLSLYVAVIFATPQVSSRGNRH